MAKSWKVYAPNGHTLTVNMGGYGSSQFRHGVIIKDEKFALAFPQYFHLQEDEVVLEMKEKAEKAAKVETLEEKLLKETSDGEQMLTEVPKKKEVFPEDDKPESSDEDSETIPLVEKKIGGRRRGRK